MNYLALKLPDINGSSNSINVNSVPTGGPGELSAIISVAVNIAVIGAIFVCLFMLISGGFDWITSQGDKQKVAKARDKLSMSIIGLILVLASFMIINILYAFFFGKVVNFLGSQ